MVTDRSAQPARARSARGEGHRLRDELLQAAVRQLSGLGSDHQLSLRAVARAAGVAPTAVYLHFADRDELLVAVLERLFTDLARVRDDAEARAAAAGGAAWERLVARSLAYVEWGISEPGAYRVLYGGRAVPRLEDPRTLTFGQGMLDRSVELVAELVATGGADPAEPPERTGLLLWIALHGVVSLRIDKDTIAWPAPEELTDQLMAGLVRPTAIGPPDSTTVSAMTRRPRPSPR